MTIQTFLKNAVADAIPYLIELRRHLHTIPELGFKLYKTSAFIKSELEKYGYNPLTGIAETGIIADLKFPQPGRCLLIRADMDGLPVQEATGLAFASIHPGCMHACGHDGHSAMVLATAKIMAELAASPLGRGLKGSIRFLFQPAEEAPGGALPMIDAGVLTGVHYCLATHIWPQVPEGSIGIKAGPLMAATDRFKITLTGKGGHSSQPHLCNDVLSALAELALILPREAGRSMNPALPGVLSICHVQAGHTYNVMPQAGELSGCTRGFHPEVYRNWEREISRITAGIAAAYGVEYKINYMPGHGAVNNDPAITALVAEAAALVVPPEHIIEPQLSLAGEDFACFQEKVPGCLFFLGAGSEHSQALHSPCFSFNESILGKGCQIFCQAVLKILAAG